MKELVLGAGNMRRKVLFFPEKGMEYDNPTYLDIDPDCNPDVIHDLNVLPYPLKDEEYDEIHAYEILEHTGTQGDWRFFFDQFSELHRILKDGGHLMISVPDGTSRLAWVDPGHTRAFPACVFGFLCQKTYEESVGKTCMADYRHYWKKDFIIVTCEVKNDRVYIVLRKC